MVAAECDKPARLRRRKGGVLEQMPSTLAGVARLPAEVTEIVERPISHPAATSKSEYLADRPLR